MEECSPEGNLTNEKLRTWDGGKGRRGSASPLTSHSQTPSPFSSGPRWNVIWIDRWSFFIQKGPKKKPCLSLCFMFLSAIQLLLWRCHLWVEFCQLKPNLWKKGNCNKCGKVKVSYFSLKIGFIIHNCKKKSLYCEIWTHNCKEKS